MANPDRPNGFRAGRPMGGVSVYQGASDASAMYQGDFVIMEATGEVDVAVAGSTALVGVADSYLAAAGDTDIKVIDDVDQVFIGQDDASGTPTQSDIGNNADILATAGSSALKQSRQEIDISSVNTTTQQLRLRQFMESPEYSIGVNSLWKVVMNEHYLNTTTGV